MKLERITEINERLKKVVPTNILSNHSMYNELLKIEIQIAKCIDKSKKGFKAKVSAGLYTALDNSTQEVVTIERNTLTNEWNIKNIVSMLNDSNSHLIYENAFNSLKEAVEYLS